MGMAEDKESMLKMQDWFMKVMLNMVEIVRGELNLLQRTLICALMVLDVHARDVIELMVAE
jgi:dynein heavy chain